MPRKVPAAHRDEGTPANTFSPGVVQGTEGLVRAIFGPLDSADYLKKEIALDDLRYRGYSVFRKLYCSKNDVIALQANRLLRGQTVEGCVEFLADEVRRLRHPSHGDSQLLAVIDDALKQIVGHASVRAIDGTQGDKYYRALRLILGTLLQVRKPLEAVEGFGNKKPDNKDSPTGQTGKAG